MQWEVIIIKTIYIIIIIIIKTKFTNIIIIVIIKLLKNYLIYLTIYYLNSKLKYFIKLNY